MSNLLRISDAASLGLHTMAYLANEPGRRVSTHEVAQALGVSENHLAKVRDRLVKAGLIEAVRGPGGGFRPTRPAGDITLLEVYEAVEGRLRPGACLLGKPLCSRGQCILGDLIGSVNKQVMDYLSGTTLDKLVCPDEQLTKH